MAQVTFQGITYQSPWFPRPAFGPIGLTVTVNALTDPNPKLAIRLRDGQNPLKTVTGDPGENSLTLIPDAPLSNLRGAFVDAQWFSGSPNWSDPQQYSSSVVITDVPTLVEGSLSDDLTQFWLSWRYPDSYVPGIGAQAMVYNTNPLTYVGFAQLQGVSGPVALNNSVVPAPGAFVQLQLMAPISGIAFAAPFTMGPVMQVYDIPVAGPIVTSAAYDGRTVQVVWTPPAIPDGGTKFLAGEIGLDLVIRSSGTNPLSLSVGAGPGGGIAEVGAFDATSSWIAGGRVRLGNIVGPVVASTAPLLTSSPSLSAITVTSTAITATATLPASAPAGTKVMVDLLSSGRLIKEVTATGTAVSFPINAIGIGDLSLVAYAQLAATSQLPALTGPRSAPFRIAAIAPTFTSITVTPAANGTDWTLTINWSYPPPAGDISTQTLVLKDSSGGTTFTFNADGPLTTYTRAVPMTSISGTLVYTLTLAAATASSTLPVATQTINFAAASFVSATSARDSISASWTVPAAGPVSAYRLRLLDLSAATPVIVAAVETAATEAAFGFGVGAVGTGNFGLDLVILNGPVTFHAKPDGTPKTVAKLLTTAPTGLLATTSEASKTTIAWNAIAQTTYLIAFADGSAGVTAASNSLLLTRTLALTDRLRLTVQAQAIANGVTVTGPASLPLQVPTAAPKLLAADTDGASISASWEPVTDSVSYTVSLMGNGAVIKTVDTTGTEINFPVTLTTDKQPYSIIVLAVTPAGTGLPSDPLLVFRTAWFVSTQPPSQAGQHLLPASDLNFAAAPITLYVPPLGPATIAATEVGAFKLSLNTDDATKTALPYLLSFAASSNVWTFPKSDASPIRSQVKSDYIAFLQAVEKAGAAPWGIALMQQLIARWMPQTFAEIPYYAFGLDLGNGNGTGSIDLRPGLVLRIGSANYVNAWSGDQPSFLNGFAGGPVMDFDIGDAVAGNGGWTVSTDAFMSRLVASGAVTVAAPTTDIGNNQAAGVAEAADLFFTGFMQPFYRLFFPGTLLNPTSMGNLAPNANFALAAADTYEHLSDSTPIPSANSTVVYFRGRAVVRVMMRVSVNGVEAVVPVGTTVGNLLDRCGSRPPATALHLTGLRLDRSGGPTLAIVSATPSPPPLIYPTGQRYQVRLDWAAMATYGGPFSALDLAVLPGDRISFP